MKIEFFNVTYLLCVAIISLGIFSIIDYYLNIFVANAVLSRSSLHGHGSIVRKSIDGIIHMLVKEEFIPNQANKFLFVTMPIFLFSCALSLWVNLLYIPMKMTIQGNLIGIYILLFVCTIIFVIIGWASNNKFSILSSLRIQRQFLYNELCLLFIILSLAIQYHSFEIPTIISTQSESIINWGMVRQPIAGLLFLIVISANGHRGVINHIYDSRELLDGITVEYSGLGRGLINGANQVINTFVKFLFVQLFCGSYHLPFDLDFKMVFSIGGDLQAVVVIVLKYIIVSFIFETIRLGFPSLKHQRVVVLIWKLLLPILSLNVLVTLILARLW